MRTFMFLRSAENSSDFR